MPDPGAKSGAVSFVTQTVGLANYVVFKPEAGQLRLDQAFDDGAVIKYMVTNGADISIERGTVTLPDTLTRDEFITSNTGSPISWPATGQRTVWPISPGLPLCDIEPVDGQVLIWDEAEQNWCPGDIATTPTTADCGVDMQNVDSGTAYSVTITKCETQVIWNSTDPGEKNTTIAAVGADQDGYLLNIKANTGDGSVHCVRATGATIGGLDSDTFDDHLCDLALVYNHAKTDWMIRCLCCYTPVECPPLVGDAVYFDGMLTSLQKLPPLGDDSPLFTFSYWIKIFNANANLLARTVWGLLWPNASHPGFYYSESGLQVGALGQLYMSNDGDTETQWMTAPNLRPIDTLGAHGDGSGRYIHYFGSVDVSSNPIQGRIFRDEEDITDFSLASNVGAGFSFPFSQWGLALPGVLPPIGHQPLTNHRMSVGDFWLAPGVFIDFSNPVNRALFHEVAMVGVTPVYLGENGELPTGLPPAVYFSGGKTQFPTNRGTAGAFDLVGTLENSLYGFKTPLPDPGTTRGGARFNGTGFMAAERDVFDPNSSKGAFSFFLRMNALPSTHMYPIVIGDLPFKFAIDLLPSGLFVIYLGNTSTGQSLTFTQTTMPFPSDGSYHHVAGTFDSQTGFFQLLIDRNPVSYTSTSIGSPGFDINYGSLSFAPYSFFRSGSGAPVTFDAAEFWCDIANTVDFSDTAILDSFVTMGLASVDLGVHGELPTGTSPTFYFAQQPIGYEAVTFFTNRGITFDNQIELFSNESGDMSFVTVAPAPNP